MEQIVDDWCHKAEGNAGSVNQEIVPIPFLCLRAQFFNHMYQILHAGCVTRPDTEIPTTTKQQWGTGNQCDLRRKQTGKTQKRVREGQLERITMSTAPTLADR